MWSSLHSYFVKRPSDLKVKYTQKYIILKVELVVNEHFVEFGGEVVQQNIGIPIGSNCVSFLVDWFFYSSEATQKPPKEERFS